MPAPFELPDSDPYHLFTPEIFSSPHAIYHLLRYEDPVHWSEATRAWVVTSYPEAKAVLHAPAFSSAARRAVTAAHLPGELRRRMEPIDRFLSQWVLNMDLPEHTRMRRILNPFFAPAAVEGLRPRIRHVAHQLLNSVAPRGGMEVVEDFAFPLPVTIISDLVGVPECDRSQLMAWFGDMSMFFEIGAGNDEVLDRMNQTVAEMKDYLRDLAAERSKTPGKDLISSILHDPLIADNEEFLLSTCVLILFSGHESTRSLIGNALLALLHHPDQKERLAGDPNLMPTAIEEFLRYEGPFMRQDRVAIEDVELRGRTIRAGQRVVVVLGAANRDPQVFQDPDQLDLARSPNRHLAFGYGIHYCLGAPLARCETEEAIRAVLARLPRVRLAAQAFRWRKHFSHRGLESLDVEF